MSSPEATEQDTTNWKTRLLQEKELWEREYTSGKTIPSTTRREPSRALRMFLPLILKDTTRTALDAGCGTGRNSIYLAERGLFVHAIDFSTAALGQLSRRARETGLEHRIHAINRSLTDPFPFGNGQMDLILDFYAFCEFTSTVVKQSYLRELERVLAPDGTVLLSLFALDDGFYSRMPRISSDSPIAVRDSYNGIPTQLYTESQIKSEVGNIFAIENFVLLEFKDLHMGQVHTRRIFTLALSKPS